MHCGLAIVLPKDYGFDGVDWYVQAVLKRYDENRDVAPYVLEVINEDEVINGINFGRELEAMIRCYGTSDLQLLAEKMEDWNGWKGFTAGDRLFYTTTQNPEGRLDGHEIMEFSGQNFPNGVGLVREFPDDEFCRALILPDGEWHEREPRHMDRHKGWPSYNPEEWTPIFQRMIREFPDNIMVTVDTHY